MVISKGRSSSFIGTGLDMFLRSNRIETVVIAGMATHACVESTARDAGFFDYYVVVVEDAVADYREDLHRASLLTLSQRVILCKYGCRQSGLGAGSLPRGAAWRGWLIAPHRQFGRIPPSQWKGCTACPMPTTRPPRARLSFSGKRRSSRSALEWTRRPTKGQSSSVPRAPLRGMSTAKSISTSTRARCARHSGIIIRPSRLPSSRPARRCCTPIPATTTCKEIELASRLGSIMPRPLQKSLFGKSGADANEMAMMIARKYTGGYEIASPHISFHGLSDSTRSVTFSGWHAGHGHLPGGSYAMVAPYCYRCPLGQTFPGCKFACLKTSFELLDAQATGRPAAVITEPLFSAGGVIEPPVGWLKALKEMCEARRMLLIVDEEQRVSANSGGCSVSNQRASSLTSSPWPSIGGGVGISAVTTTAEIEDKVVREGYAATHSHANDPLICAAGTASLDVIEQEDVPGKARRIGMQMRERLEAFQQRFEMIGDIRGRGQLMGVELVRSRHTKEPATEEGRGIGQYCFDHGLIFSIRRSGSVLRFVPPATTRPDQLTGPWTSWARPLKLQA